MQKLESGAMVKRMSIFFLRLIGALILLSLMVVVIYRFVPVVITPLMCIRVVEHVLAGRWQGIDQRWVAADKISPHFMRAVIASEDARFLAHHGIDWEAVEEARRRNDRMETLYKARKIKKKRLYGASTITMQTAKNAFLAPSRTYIRKALEAYFTYVIEFVWGKFRILEVYANIIEMGDGIYGVEAASQRYFGVSAAHLSRQQAALLAAILPNPRAWSPTKPSAYIRRKAATIQSRMESVALP